MAAILIVRVKSDLEQAELEKRALKRKPEFEKVPGLIQKIYCKDPDTEHVCGIYFFDSKESLTSYTKTELAKTIPTAYEATEIRKEVYELMYPLHPDRGPFSN